MKRWTVKIKYSDKETIHQHIVSIMKKFNDAMNKASESKANKS